MNRYLSKSLFLTLFIAGSALAEFTVGSVSQTSLTDAGAAPAGGSVDPSLGTIGKKVVFTSNATDLVSGDTNQNNDVYERNLKTGAYARISVDSAGGESFASSDTPSISPVTPDGFYAIAFRSFSDSFGTISGLSQADSKIFVRFPTLGLTEIASPAMGFTVPFGDSKDPSITVNKAKDGKNIVSVVYASDVNNLVSGDTNSFTDIFLAKFVVPVGASASNYIPSQNLVVQRISEAADSAGDSNGNSEAPVISGDGNYVVFVSQATNIVSGFQAGNASFKQVFRYDLKTKQAILISKDKGGAGGTGDSFLPNISFNGNFITYITQAPSIVSGLVTAQSVLVRYDVLNDITEVVNKNSAGDPGNGAVQSASMLGDGRIVVYSDTSSDLVQNDTNMVSDVFVRDMGEDTSVRLSVGPSGVEGDSDSDKPAISTETFSSLTANIIFESHAANLTNPSLNSPDTSNIFQTSITLSPPPIENGASIGLPPDLKVRSKTLTFTAQKYSVGSPTTTASIKVRYQFDITKTVTRGGKTTKSRIRKIEKRNTITLRKSKAKYSVRYRALNVNASTGRIVSKTGFSPRQNLVVN